MGVVDFFVNLPAPLLQHWGYWIVLAASFIETLPIVGGFIPGQTIVIAAGFFVKLGMLDIEDVVAIAALGAIVGDCLGYWLGRRYGYDFIQRYGRHVFFKPEAFEKTRDTLQAHAGKTLILGRFVPLTRALAPFVAGASHIRFRRFLVYNIIGGVLWAAASIGAGYVFGASYELAAHYFGRAILFILITIGAVWLLMYWYRRMRTLPAAYPLRATVTNAISLVVFGWLAHLAVASWRVRALDLQVFLWLETQRVAGANAVMLVASRLFDPPFFAVWMATLAVWLVWFRRRGLGRRWFDLCVALATLGGGVVIGTGVKLLVHRPRPSPGVILETGFSFPSLHATAVALLALVIGYLVQSHPSLVVRRGVQVLAALVCVVVGFSRMYLGVHWLSDVVAGYALALFWFTFVLIVARLFRPHPNSFAPMTTRSIRGDM